ncbi:fimbrial protein [Entomohabitans teleogrylli]|uniref:fimbrial protein n=1 Tax=Entomohabitans teleogrylli TaxID=1384589 RepID=UPI0008FC8FA9|nr:fimbrial protein [Entomohabitans teleogrylli]
MKLNKALVSVAVASAFMASSAFAADGTIYFEGELVAATCDISVNGQTSPATVVLPTVSINLLTAAGQTTGTTGFNIELANCDSLGTISTAAAFFEAGSTVDPVNYRLNNTDVSANAATNVQLQLLDHHTQNAIKIGDTSQTSGAGATTRIDVSSGSATLPYAVEYYAMGPTTPGVVTSMVNFSIDYQ